MVNLSELQKFLDNYMYYDRKMDMSRIDPYMTNGLMVKGKEEVNRIGFGVSASLEFFKKAKEKNCDALIVHHTFNFPVFNHYDPIFQNRIGFLIKNDISLFGYHFLFDSHPEVGNNVQILETIGAKPVRPFILAGNPWGWIGEYKKAIQLSQIVANLKPYLSSRTVIYDFGPEEIIKVVAVSGKGAPSPAEMAFLKNNEIDLYITGEVHEWNRELFREAGINFIAGGHYCTEVFGLKALMDKITNNLPGAESEWLKLHNEI